ncbi:MAG: hypothetical protein ACRCTE_11360 [Cellulosilyticaceae bacterium]
MTVADVVSKLGLGVLAGETGLHQTVEGGYTGDLLSFVMGHAKEGNVWFTIQGHLNSVAVASLLGLSAIVLAEGVTPTEDMIAKANEEGIPVLGSHLTSFELVVAYAACV